MTEHQTPAVASVVATLPEWGGPAVRLGMSIPLDENGDNEAMCIHGGVSDETRERVAELRADRTQKGRP